MEQSDYGRNDNPRVKRYVIYDDEKIENFKLAGASDLTDYTTQWKTGISTSVNAAEAAALKEIRIRAQQYNGK